MDGKPDRGHVRVGPLDPVSLVWRDHPIATYPQPPPCITLDRQAAKLGRGQRETSG